MHCYSKCITKINYTNILNYNTGLPVQKQQPRQRGIRSNSFWQMAQIKSPPEILFGTPRGL